MSCNGPKTSKRFTAKEKSEILLAQFHFYAVENALHFPLCDLPTQVMDLVL